MGKSDDLARRAVAAPHWRWLPGMATTDGARLLFEDRTLGWQAWSLDHRRHTLGATDATLPDLADPATLGCLLALVREAWDWPNAFACHDEIGWYVPNGQTGCSVEWQIEASDGERHDTEAAALVAALEAAP